MDIRHLLGKLDTLNEGTIADAKKKPTGPKFTGKWRGTDPASAAKTKYVGGESILRDLESTLQKEAPARDLMREFKEFKELNESTPDDKGAYQLQPIKKSSEPGATEDLDEVAMNPTAFAQAIKTGQDKGVLVGFEFETCIPQAVVQQWKTGDVPPDTPTYDPESTAWIEGKTVADLIGGIAAKANGQLGNTMDDLFKYKGAVATSLGVKSPWDSYKRWVGKQVSERMASENNTKVVFEKLAELLKDPEVAAMPIEYGYSSEREGYGPSSAWNGRTFTIEIIKRETGVDFGKRVPKSQLTPELAEKVQAACHKAYQITRGPYDSRINAVGNALANRRHEIEGDYYFRGYGLDMGAERIAAVKQHFMNFAEQVLGTADLKELLLKKLAFKGRVNNATPVLKEKLWYYVTAGAEPPASLRTRGYGRTSYRDGADFLKDNLKDVYGDSMTIFTGYHQATKQLDRWYIEPDGSLRPNSDDYSAEVVSPPLPAEQAMSALRTWYQKAQQLKLYTNGSTGLHINVSIPGNLDVLKLAVFSGDTYVLKKFGRENNSYARSVIKNLKGTGDLPRLGSKEFSAAEAEMKSIVKRISGDHFATVNFNGKYVSFRHAGGDYLNKMSDIVNTVGRFVRAMVIAADSTAYRDEYVGKLVKLMKPEAGDADDKLPLSDIRTVATKGIPVQIYDVVYRPVDVNAETLEPNVEGGQEAIQRKIKDNFRSSISYQIIPDPSVRDRLLNDTGGFASNTKAWLESAPDSAFVRVVIYPNNRKDLDVFGDRLAADSGVRTSAFGMYDRRSDKVAVGSRYTRVVKQGDTEFKDAVTALRGGAVKPAPLPGSKAASAVQPATVSSQQQDTPGSPSNTSNQGNWGIWIVTDRRFSRMPNTIISDNNFRRFDRREAAEQWLERTRAENPRMRTDLEVREIEPAQSDNQEQGRTGPGTVPHQQPTTDTNQEQRYVLFNPTNRMVIQRYHGSLRDTFAVAQSIANRQGHEVGIENSQGEVVDTARPVEAESRVIESDAITKPTLGTDLTKPGTPQQQQQKQQQQDPAQQAELQKLAQQEKAEQANLQKGIANLKAAGAAVSNPAQVVKAFDKVDDQQPLTPADKGAVATAGTVLAPIMANPQLQGKFKDLVTQASAAQKKQQQQMQKVAQPAGAPVIGPK